MTALRHHGRGSLLEVLGLFLRLGLTAFGGPAAHVALMERECVRTRKWIGHDEFLDLLGAANLIPGPTSTEMAMHIGRHRAGWPGLIVAGLAFTVPAAVMVGILAAVYVRAGQVPSLRGVLLAVQPVVLVVILDALVPLARSAIRSARTAVIALAAAGLVAAGLPEIAVLLLGGVAHVTVRPRALVLAGVAAVTVSLAAQSVMPVTAWDVFAYFATVGSLLFGSGYVLLSVLEGDLVSARGWLTTQQLLDAIAAGQATPGPVFTTATFVGYLLGGPSIAVVATLGMFLPAFVFASMASASLHRIRDLPIAQSFLAGVNAASVALIAIVLASLATSVLRGWAPVTIALAAAALLFLARVNSSWLLLGAAVIGGVMLR